MFIWETYGILRQLIPIALNVPACLLSVPATGPDYRAFTGVTAVIADNLSLLFYNRKHYCSLSLHNMSKDTLLER